MVRSGAARQDIDRAAELVRAGGIIAFPTETYYGLGVDPFNSKALEKLFAVKGRPAVKPVLVLVAGRDQVGLLASEIPAAAHQLMDIFWPGPLTIVLPARRELSPLLTGGTGTVGIRHSPHPLPNDLLQTLGSPLTATSANRSGEPAAVTADEVFAVFGDRIDMILDGGRTPGQQGSTLVRPGPNTVECIREGCIPCATVLASLQATRG